MAGGPSKINPPNSNPSNPIYKNNPAATNKTEEPAVHDTNKTKVINANDRNKTVAFVVGVGTADLLIALAML